jgi:hypothetical protein
MAKKPKARQQQAAAAATDEATDASFVKFDGFAVPAFYIAGMG